MTATLLWSGTQNWQEPLPIPGNTPYTVEYAIDVPAISPSGTPVMFVFSDTYYFNWVPNVGTPLPAYFGYYGFAYFMTTDDRQGGQLTTSKTFYPQQYFVPYYSTPGATPPAWAKDAYNQPNTSIAVYIWDAETVDFQGFPQGVMPAFSLPPTITYSAGYLSPVSGSGAGPSPHEDVAYSFPASTIDPAIDTIWVAAQPRLTPMPAPWYSGFQYSGVMLTGTSSVAPNDFTMYSAAQHVFVIGPDSGSPSVTGGYNDSVQLPSYTPLPTFTGTYTDAYAIQSNYHNLPFYNYYNRGNPETGWPDPLTCTLDSWVNFSLQSNSGHIHNYDANFSFQWYFLNWTYDPAWYNNSHPYYTPLGDPVQWTIPRIPNVPTSDPCRTGSDSIFHQGYDTFVTSAQMPANALSFVSTVTQRSAGIGNPPLYYNAQIIFMDSGSNPLLLSPIFQQYYGGRGIDFYNYTTDIPSGTDHIDFHVWWEGFGPSILWSELDAHVSYAIYCDVTFPPGTLQSRQLISVQSPSYPGTPNPLTFDLAYQIFVTAQNSDNGASPSNSFYQCKDVYGVAFYIEGGNDTRYLSELIPGHNLEILLWDQPTLRDWTYEATVATVIDDTHAELTAPIPSTASFGPYVFPTQTYTIPFVNATPSVGPDVLPTPITIPGGATHVYVDATITGSSNATTYLMIAKGYLPGGSATLGSYYYLGSGNVVYQFTGQSPPYPATQYVSVFDNGAQGDASGNQVPHGWWINDLYPIHRLIQLNTAIETFTPAFIYGYSPPDGCQIDLTITFMALVSQYYFQGGPTTWQPVAQSSDFQQAPTISGAPDTQYSWQDNTELAYPGNFSLSEATYTGGSLPATGGKLFSRPTLSAADYDGAVAVDYGPVDGVGGIYTYASVPNYYYGDNTIVITTSPVTSEFATFDGLIFRTLPQNNSCMFLGAATIHSNYTNTPYTYYQDPNTFQYVYVYTNALTPSPTAFDPALTIVKTVTCGEFAATVAAMSLASDGTVWLSGTPDSSLIANNEQYGPPWLTGSDHFFIRPSEWGFTSNDLPRQLSTALDGTPLPPMVDIDINGDDSNGVTWMMLDNQGNLWGMGYNFYGQLGIGASSRSDEGYIDTDFFVRAPVVVFNNVSTFKAGYNKSMLVSNGQLYVCGRAGATTLGLAFNPPPRIIDTWTPVPGMTGVRQIADLGHNFQDAGYVCLMADGSVWGWTGDAWNSGFLGAYNYATYPRGINPATGFAQWPPVFYGATGSWVPIPELGTGNREIQASGVHQGFSIYIYRPALYTLTAAGQILITGWVDKYGSAGDGVTVTETNTTTLPPFQVLMPTPPAPPIIDPLTGDQQIDPVSGEPMFGPTPPPVTAVKLAQSQEGMAFIGNDGQVYTWGYNGQAQLGWTGVADTDPHPTPAAVPGLDQIPGLTPTGVYRDIQTIVLFAGALPAPTITTAAHHIVG